MTESKQQALINQLDEARASLEKLLPDVDPAKEIYPGWTIRQLLAHITGWDDSSIESLRAHLAGQPPATPADRGIDEYNVRTVTSRQSLDLEHVTKEFRQTREILKKLIAEMPEDKFTQKLVTAWGERGTVTGLAKIFIEHEKEHTSDILTWLKNPDQPLKKGAG